MIRRCALIFLLAFLFLSLYPSVVFASEHKGDKADILVMATHPDDDVLYFGVATTIYAVNKGYHVQAAIITPANNVRRIEAIDGQKALGNTRPPVFGEFSNAAGTWYNNPGIEGFIISQIRKYKPDIILMHDSNGEYGHPAHKVISKLTLNCVKKSGDSDFYPASVKEHGTWVVAKAYMHLYRTDNQVIVDWTEKIPAMGNQTAIDIANGAYRKHASQYIIGNHNVVTSGKEHCSFYGLIYSNVGMDTIKNDIMENITFDSLVKLNPEYYTSLRQMIKVLLHTLRAYKARLKV